MQSIDIPNSVTHIGYDALQGCSSLQSINVSYNNLFYKSVDGILYDKKLETIIRFPPKHKNTVFTIPNSVIRIDYKAFSECTNLLSLTIPKNVTSINYEAFRGCSALIDVYASAFFKYDYSYVDDRQVNFGYEYDIKKGKTIKAIESKYIRNIDIPNDVIYIGDEVFKDCTTLQNINIPDSVILIGNEAFSGCSSLQNINIPNSVTHIGEEAFKGCSSLQSIDIPDTVTRIGLYAFYECSSLQTIDIPNSVTHIASDAFYGCTSLQSINIPMGVNDIYEGLDIDFWGSCHILQSINVSNENSVYKSIDGVLYDKDLKKIIRFPPNHKNIAFIIPKSVTYIGNNAFSYCSSLQSIDIPNSVTHIGYQAFYNCSSLLNINIPKSVTYIGSLAFDGLKNIFIRCDEPEKIDVAETAFCVDLDECVLHIPCGTRWAYKHHPTFSRFKNIVADIFD